MLLPASSTPTDADGGRRAHPDARWPSRSASRACSWTSTSASASRCRPSTATTSRCSCAAPTSRCTSPRASGTGIEVYDAARDPQLARPPRHGDRAARGASTQGQLELHYQPKARLRDGTVVGVEALVRWRHPERGLVPPDEFIPLAERTGLVHQLTAHVLRRGRSARRARGGTHGPARAGRVNVSMRDLHETDLAGARRRRARPARPAARGARARGHRERARARRRPRRRHAARAARDRRLRRRSTTSARATPRSCSSSSCRSTR